MVCDVSAAGAGWGTGVVCDVSSVRPGRDDCDLCDVPTGGNWRNSGSVRDGNRTQAGGMRFPPHDADTWSIAGRDFRGDAVADRIAVRILGRS